MRSVVALALLVASSSALAASPGKQSVCHQDGNGTFNLINISVNAVATHLTNHGDVLPGAYHPDADGDGFGAMDGLVLPCPTAGYTLDASDCDDTDFTINPGAEDVCGDEIDNDCDLNADEDCGPACPCAEYPAWTDALENGVPDLFCVDNAEAAGSYYTTDGVTFGYVVGVSFGGEFGICYGSASGSFFEEYGMAISGEEALACMNDISAWLDANGATCAE